MTRNVTRQLPESIRNTPTPSVGHRAAQAGVRQSPTLYGRRGKGICGWVTAVEGIPRTGQLRLIGNGVVPQQGAAALAVLLRIAARYPATGQPGSPGTCASPGAAA
jgi:hypothetical protein